MRANSRTDLVAGLCFALLGIGIIVVASQYKLGTAADMGPGYFPRLLGGLLVLLGAAIGLLSFRGGATPPTTLSIRGLLVIAGSVVLFGAALPYLGLVVTVFIVTVFSSVASPRFSLRRAAISGMALATLCYLIFVTGLDLFVPVWPHL